MTDIRLGDIVRATGGVPTGTGKVVAIRSATPSCSRADDIVDVAWSDRSVTRFLAAQLEAKGLDDRWPA